MTPFHILHVCVANICRSPMAEWLTRQEIGERLGPAGAAFVVSSAGTRGHAGSPMHHHGAGVLRSVGVEPDGFVARVLTADLLRGADLVLTATTVERDQAVELLPAALNRTFTLLEFARLLAAVPADLAGPPADLAAPSADPAERGRRTVVLARRMRGRLPYVDPSVDDLADPVRTPEGFRRCLLSAAPAVATIIAALGGEGAPVSALGGTRGASA
ncbi:MAG: low molecular weight protein-tyrosine phosphatase [Micromonosporaceae bacterium]|nr:low molecular weight protein-tyrosine phosphatase [Micromonosporaceae bacterium]